MTGNRDDKSALEKAENYQEYLGLEAILSSQERYSEKNGDPVHDETLFIILHQTIELWFLQALGEVDEARRLIRKDCLGRACEELERIVRIFSDHKTKWDVMATLRPYEFWKFRKYFGEASGFQSAQFRQFEFALGLRGGSKALVAYQEEGSKSRAALEAELGRPSLWDEVNFALARIERLDFELPPELAARTWSDPYPYPRRKPTGDRKGAKAHSEEEGHADPENLILGCAAVEDAWFKIHKNRHQFPDAYRLGERLLDVSAAFGSWRAKHIATVERFIGNLQGTGKKGVRYLRSTLRPNKRPFPELWSVRDRFDKLLEDSAPQS